MKSIFIVLGVTGENEQQRSWLVKAFPSEESALHYIEKLEATYQSATDDEDFNQESEDELIEAMKALDENFEFDADTGTEYSITECPFEDRQRSRDQVASRDSKSPRRRARR